VDTVGVRSIKCNSLLKSKKYPIEYTGYVNVLELETEGERIGG
jgi:hypothetical protein